jgi:transposase-like protein
MDAEAQGLCGARYGEVSADRVNFRNGYRPRDIDTRVGTIELAIPRLRRGSYFPEWLLEPRRRAEQALTQVVCQCYVEGVSTRRVDDIVKTLGIEGISRSQVSRLAKALDVTVEAFRCRPLDAGPYTYVWLDALTQKVREGGRIVNVACVIATGVNANGYREVLGLDVITTEDGAGVAGVPAQPGGPRAHRCAAGDLRRPRGPQGRHRGGPGRRRLAALPRPCDAQPDDQGPQGLPVDGRHAGAHHLRAA